MTTLESLLWQLYEGQVDVLAQIGDLLEEAGDARAQDVRDVDLTPRPVRVFVQIGPAGEPVRASTTVAAADEGELSVRLKEVEDSSGGHYLADTMPTLGSASASADARLRAARDVLRLFPEVELPRKIRDGDRLPWANPDAAPIRSFPKDIVSTLRIRADALAATIRLPPLWPDTEPVASYPTSVSWGQAGSPLADFQQARDAIIRSLGITAHLVTGVNQTDYFD
jgi:hypothetical protein